MLSNFAFLDLGTPELLIILAIVLLLFGGANLPKLSRALGQSMREIRKGLSDDVHETPKSKNTDEKNEPSDKA
jgi:sec-independent protein translocase protein TatA